MSQAPDFDRSTIAPQIKSTDEDGNIWRIYANGPYLAIDHGDKGWMVWRDDLGDILRQLEEA